MCGVHDDHNVWLPWHSCVCAQGAHDGCVTVAHVERRHVNSQTETCLGFQNFKLEVHPFRNRSFNLIQTMAQCGGQELN